MKKVKKLFLSVFFAIFSSNFFCAVENPLLTLSAQICRFIITNDSSFFATTSISSTNSESVQLAQSFAKTFSFPFLVLTSRHWTFSKGSVPLFDLIAPSYEGFLDSLSVYESSFDSGNLMKTFFLASSNQLTVQKPLELEQEVDLSNDLPQKLPSNESNEKRLKDSLGSLSFYSVDNEILSVQNLEKDRILIRKYENHLVRKFYDEKMRLIKQETWNINSNFADSKIEKKEDFFYKENSLIPFSCEIIENNSSFHELLYDEKGRVVSSKNSSLQDEKKQLQSFTTWKYDEKNRITEKQTEDYVYKKGSFSKIEKIENKKEVFLYKIEEGQPDYYYSENGEVKLKTEFSSVDDYVTTMNFDNGFIVESFYKNGIRKKDIYYLNGVIRRVKQYDE